MSSSLELSIRGALDLLHVGQLGEAEVLLLPLVGWEGSPEEWHAHVAALRAAQGLDPLRRTCPGCDGDGEVHVGSSVPDDEGFATCPVCAGSRVLPSWQEIAALRREAERLAGDLQAAEGEVQMWKEQFGENSLQLDKPPTMAGSLHDCEKDAPPGFLTSGHRQDGEAWTCPVCAAIWVHVCDEAAGGSWRRRGRGRRRA